MAIRMRIERGKDVPFNTDDYPPPESGPDIGGITPRHVRVKSDGSMDELLWDQNGGAVVTIPAREIAARLAAAGTASPEITANGVLLEVAG